MVLFATFVVKIGVGFTVMGTFTAAPTHPFNDGVIEYVITWLPVELLVSNWAMVSLDPENAPIILLFALTVHPYVIPGIFPLKIKLVLVPLQMDCDPGLTLATGIGFTVTSACSELPTHPSAEGVMV
jgi:hypothetical protein